MIAPLCPICARTLQCGKTVWQCEAGHSFDVARQGYVNLLTVDRKHSLHPGDTREMVIARREFLDAGYYAPIADTLHRLLQTFAPNAQRVLDAGCGEGYYLGKLTEIPDRWGIDISKEAVRYAAARDKDAHFLTATAAHLPFSDGSFDCVLSMFALTAAEEFARVLRDGGIFVQVLAGEKHLLGLKQIIYSELLEKEKQLHQELPHFSLLHSETLRFSFTLSDAETVHDLLYMTPHVWRISKQGAARLAQTDALTDTAEVIFNVYSRQPRENLIK